MDQKEIIKKIKTAQNLLNECLLVLEGTTSSQDNTLNSTSVSQNKKIPTLRELIKGRDFNNGPEKIAVIVGYHEKIKKELISKEQIPQEWKDSKMKGVYKTNLLNGATGDYVREVAGGKYDLSQSGEDFFDNFVKNESTTKTS